MLWRLPTSRRAVSWGVVLALFGGLAGGCASSRSAETTADARSNVVGLWEYRTQGTSALQHGTLRIAVVDGQLVGRLRDSWRGDLRAQIAFHGHHLELDLGGLRITGRVRRGEFRASIRRAFGDLSVQRRRRRDAALFVARRIRSGVGSDSQDHYGCRSLMYEHSYLCSPFQAQGIPPPA